MASYATTRLSSKGQVVIPEEIRNNLGLSEGDQFVVIGEGDSVILKTITPPKIEEFNKLLSQARSAAKRAGIKRADLKSAIAKVRHRTKRKSRRSSTQTSSFQVCFGRALHSRFSKRGRSSAFALRYRCPFWTNTAVSSTSLPKSGRCRCSTPFSKLSSSARRSLSRSRFRARLQRS